jgi:hypothetical protein
MRDVALYKTPGDDHATTAAPTTLTVILEYDLSAEPAPDPELDPAGTAPGAAVMVVWLSSGFLSSRAERRELSSNDGRSSATVSKCS